MTSTNSLANFWHSTTRLMVISWLVYIVSPLMTYAYIAYKTLVLFHRELTVLTNEHFYFACFVFTIIIIKWRTPFTIDSFAIQLAPVMPESANAINLSKALGVSVKLFSFFILTNTTSLFFSLLWSFCTWYLIVSFNSSNGTKGFFSSNFMMCLRQDWSNLPDWTHRARLSTGCYWGARPLSH